MAGPCSVRAVQFLLVGYVPASAIQRSSVCRVYWMSQWVPSPWCKVLCQNKHFLFKALIPKKRKYCLNSSIIVQMEDIPSNWYSFQLFHWCFTQIKGWFFPHFIIKILLYIFVSDMKDTWSFLSPVRLSHS